MSTTYSKDTERGAGRYVRARGRTVFSDSVKALIENEWEILLRNRVTVFTTLVPPMGVVILALIALFMSQWIDTSIDPSTATAASLQELRNSGLASALQEAQSLQTNLRFVLLSSLLIILQILPLVVPMSIASHAIVGEKQNRSLEPLLAAPITTGELLTAKAFAAVVPGLLVTWIGYALFAFGARFAVSEQMYHNIIVGPTWITSIILLTPLFTLFTVAISIIISSRVKDATSAQQLGTIVILPLVGIMIIQMIGVTNSSMALVLLTSAGIAVVDVIVMKAAIRIFQREEILTTWR